MTTRPKALISFNGLAVRSQVAALNAAFCGWRQIDVRADNVVSIAAQINEMGKAFM
jgi:hypothetical protein